MRGNTQQNCILSALYARIYPQISSSVFSITSTEVPVKRQRLFSSIIRSEVGMFSNKCYASRWRSFSGNKKATLPSGVPRMQTEFLSVAGESPKIRPLSLLGVGKSLLQNLIMGIIQCKFWCWVWIRWKKCEKITQKRCKPKTFAQSQKTLFIADNFFATFSTYSNSASIFAFFDTHIAFMKNSFFYIILALFTNFEVKRGRNGLKNGKRNLQMCLRIKFCYHQRPGRAKFLKALYPIVHALFATSSMCGQG